MSKHPLRPLFSLRWWTLSSTPRSSRARALRRSAYERHKEDARRLIVRKLEEFNRHYGFAYGRVAIRDQRSRWGSCSKKGNLNFNYRLLHLPEPLADLIIVHELCHLREFNHSPAFWRLVEETIPDASERRSLLSLFPIARLISTDL